MMVGLADEWAAYQFDAAALYLSRLVQAALVNKEDVSELLGSAVQSGQFRSPAGLVRRKMKVPESGVW